MSRKNVKRQSKMHRIEEIIQRIADIEKLTFSDAWSYESIADTIRYDYNHLYVAYLDENGMAHCESYNCYEGGEQSVCGYLIASQMADESELLRVAVTDECRKKGIGRCLLKYYLTDIQGSRYFLEVRESNTAARGLYEKLGYKTLGYRKAYYHEPDEAAVIYELEK